MASNILASTTTLMLTLCALASVSTAFVVDTDGQPLLNGGQYYILPQNIGIGGGLSLKPKKEDDSPCPLYITRDKDETSPGIPVRISSPLRIAFITPSLPITIVFKDVPNVCMRPLGWQVVHDSSDRAYVATGGRGDFFSSTETFMIQKSEEKNHVYKIQLAADKKNVGIFDKDGLLGITNDSPLLVVFKKAYDDVLAMKVY